MVGALGELISTALGVSSSHRRACARIVAIVAGGLCLGLAGCATNDDGSTDWEGTGRALGGLIRGFTSGQSGYSQQQPVQQPVYAQPYYPQQQYVQPPPRSNRRR